MYCIQCNILLFCSFLIRSLVTQTKVLTVGVIVKMYKRTCLLVSAHSIVSIIVCKKTAFLWSSAVLRHRKIAQDDNE